MKDIPSILVLFGATGDLMAKKIVPALFHLFIKQKLPSHFKIVGFARREMTDEQFHEHIARLLESHAAAREHRAAIAPFLRFFSYQQGFFDGRAHYEHLQKELQNIDDAWGMCTNKLFYLAVPPEFYKTIFGHLSASGLTAPCSPEEGWTRVLVEKPFGKDAKTAEDIDKLLGKLFREEQVYRIDHYLAKEMIQSILSFRFSNNLFEEIWSNEHIESIKISLRESIGVEHRGSFYDGLGALRDVGQNHLLQMLALVTMEHPQNLEGDAIRKERAQLLAHLERFSARDVAARTFRAQYEGYRAIAGVHPDSNAETYFNIKTFLHTPRWEGVPITLESGKRMGAARKEIVVTLKHPMPCLCPKGTVEHYKNKVIFSLEPREGITIQFWSKKPGLEFAMEERDFNFFLRAENQRAQYVEEYEKLLLDAIAGDQMLFLSTAEVSAMWAFIDPITTAWEKGVVPLASYAPDTMQAHEEAQKIDSISAVQKQPAIRKEIGIIGLGKMGENIAQRLAARGWRVHGFDQKEGSAFRTADSLGALVGTFIVAPRIVFLMVPAGKAVDEVIFGKQRLVSFLGKGDILIDGGNSFYKDSAARSKKLAKYGIAFIDVGVSGGPGGALRGASLMVGGDQKTFKMLEPLFADMAVFNGYQFFEGAGAGHFVKMIHNGIEYGVMQALAEGFAIMKKSRYEFDLSRVADIYNHGSVVESRLVGWLKEAFTLYGEDLKNVSGSVAHTGEGAWMVQTAGELKVKTKVIEEALAFRKRSEKNPSYTGKILSALRARFGGHSLK